MTNISDSIDQLIMEKIVNFDYSVVPLENSFEELISLGEIIDRLSIVNLKLYLLKDKVMMTESDEFRSWASVEDIKLVKERARLKKCLDEKI